MIWFVLKHSITQMMTLRLQTISSIIINGWLDFAFTGNLHFRPKVAIRGFI